MQVHKEAPYDCFALGTSAQQSWALLDEQVRLLMLVLVVLMVLLVVVAPVLTVVVLLELLLLPLLQLVPALLVVLLLTRSVRTLARACPSGTTAARTARRRCANAPTVSQRELCPPSRLLALILRLLCSACKLVSGSICC